MNSLGNVGIYWLAVVIFVLWMVVVVARTSGLMAVATFFFWPVSVFHLLANWGDPDSDIRIPFFLTLLATGMLMYSASQVVDDVAMQFTQEDIEHLRQSDPEAANEIQRRQLEAMGVHVEVEGAPGGNAGASYANNPAAREAATDSEVAIPAKPQVRNIPVDELNFRTGKVGFGAAFATLDIPGHFRFIPVEQLGTLASMRKVTLDDSLLGWLVHERVDLNTPDFWYVDVRFQGGYVAAPPPAPVVLAAPTPTCAEAGACTADDPDAAAAPVPPAIDPYALAWDAERAVGTWAQTRAEDPDQDLCAARLLRHGVLVYCVPDLAAEQRELGLRAARLMAERTRIDKGWNHANFSGATAGRNLAQWVTDRQPPPAEAPELDAESAEHADTTEG